MNHAIIHSEANFFHLPAALQLALSSESTNDEENSFEDDFFEKQHKSNTNLQLPQDEKFLKQPDFTKYKTEICRSWQEKRYCTYGKKCMFAHGKEELMGKEFFGGYKSKLCRSFHQKFYCPYGSRCMFIHGNKGLGQILGKNFYMKKINAVNFGEYEENRLKIFKEISNMKIGWLKL
jgi:hypothetical protein